ncbi:iron chelate uptake ABC transporter family permease subunit [Gordonia sp. ABSL1-1]|uniref:FecCD family ABC transporter permease n=1 Tax=Gordonia sp. ABSL1-1 TaxID=3053923 RepID=UPI002573AEF6|nr:iron chelate uptake ABC transporter family permease subunit [Gordonia sp. ABSL1-1]MDL9938971.1 iron chelate uptake ABC transporter family permease subunit [Gordonia sp. ABSL1-1]
MKPTVDFGRPTLRMRAGSLSMRVDRRSLVVATILTIVTLVAAVVALGSGEYSVAPWDVVTALFGGGDPIDRLAIREFQAHRVVAALAFGAALGLSGAIFQLLTRNPLGSPDIIGFGVGSYTGALIVGLVFSGSYLMTASGALIGGLATALVVYALAFRQGVGGFRLVIIGVAVSAMLAAANYWLILRADLGEAMDAAQWGAGNLGTVTWDLVTPAVVVIVVLIVGVAVLARRLPVLDLGPDLARTLGAENRLSLLGLPILGVALTAAATAVAGPISFIALAAPHIARRLVGGGQTPLVATALTGSALLVISDVIATRAFAPKVLPVGVVTVCLGGCYLSYLLYRELRQDR